MKRKLLSLGLLAAGLLTAGNVMAGTTTYDFSTLTAVSTSSTAHHSGMYPLEQDGFTNITAFSAGASSNTWIVKSNTGLYLYAGGGRNFGILDLKVGDQVAFYVSAAGTIQSTSTAALAEDGTAITTIAAGSSTSATTYTVTTAGYLDINVARYTYLYKIVVTSNSESVSAPALAITGANGGNRTVTITPGTSDEGNTVTTYYTTNGEDPTTSSDVYTEALTISSSCTVKAMTVSSAGTSSSVASLEVEAGTTLSLAATTYSITAMTANGDVYNATFAGACDNSEIIGAPTATISATFNGEEVQLPYIVTSEGTLVITSSAEGYESTSVTIDAAGGYTLTTETVDFGTINSSNVASLLGSGYTEATSPSRWSSWAKGAGYNLDGTAGSTDSNDNYYYYSITSGTKYFDLFTASGSNIILNVGYGFMNTGKGTASLAIEAEDNSIAEFVVNYGRGGSTADVSEFIVASDGSISYALGSYGYPYVAQVKYYTPYEEPQAVTKSITSGGYATFASEYAVSIPNGITAYYITEDNLDLDNNQINMTKITAETIPANTGIVIEGNEGDYEFPIVESSDTEISGNLMKVANGSTECGDNCYGIHKTQGIFVKLKNGTVLSTGKAYLDLSSVSSAKLSNELIIANDNVNAINEVNAAAKSGKIYNLQGIEVKNASNGLYIVNGKKVIK